MPGRKAIRASAALDAQHNPFTRSPEPDWNELARQSGLSGPEPTTSQLEEWMMDGVAEATDGCRIEPDGTCEHGHPSWLIHLGLI
jgi:hypothetical protein